MHAYVELLSNWYSGLLFLAGFTLTAMITLVTKISEPISVSAQLILLFFGCLFQLTACIPNTCLVRILRL